jgi:hypothetical protein
MTPQTGDCLWEKRHIAGASDLPMGFMGRVSRHDFCRKAGFAAASF